MLTYKYQLIIFKTAEAFNSVLLGSLFYSEENLFRKKVYQKDLSKKLRYVPKVQPSNSKEKYFLYYHQN